TCGLWSTPKCHLLCILWSRYWTNHLMKPYIIINPDGVITSGQNVSITCLVAEEQVVKTFLLVNAKDLSEKDHKESNNSATFQLSPVTLQGEGSYQCQFEIMVSDKMVTSPLSDPIQLKVVVCCQHFIQHVSSFRRISQGCSVRPKHQEPAPPC
uniref:Ig-like domain-containing protein n=1 Tax=Nothobranchius furzeri TaxID=105023 RepID=A0A8C6M7U1_NOTFU